MEPNDRPLDRPELPPGREAPSASDAPTREDLPGSEAPPRAADGPKRLLRPRDDRILAGVSGGLGRYFGVDPVLFRLAFVVLVFAGGAGVIAYVLAAILIPSDPSTPRTPWRERAGGGANLVRAGVAVLAVIAALLLACGVGIVAALGGGTAIALLVIAAGIAMVVLGASGRGRWIVVPALILAAPLAIVAAADIDLDGGIGDREYRPQTRVELADGYELGAGDLTLDLSDLELPPGRTNLAVDLGVGRTTVVVPDDVCVDSRVRVGAGEVQVFDRQSSGLGVDVSWPSPPRAARPELVLDAHIGAGGLDVRYAGPQYPRVGNRCDATA